MVRGIDSFREWFRGYEDCYAIIGGTACDLLMSDEGLSFRATKDIDLVLIIEALDADFGRQFWEYIVSGDYEHQNKSTGNPQFYRFTDPKSSDYPAMIELFTRRTDQIVLPDQAVLTPLSIDEDVSSLSAILLDDDYYDFLRHGTVRVSDVSILDAAHLIPFKAKAWLDLSDKKESGRAIDSRNIKKHKNDVFRLTELLDRDSEAIISTPEPIRAELNAFFEKMLSEDVDLKALGIVGRTKERILDELKRLYGL